MSTILPTSVPTKTLAQNLSSTGMVLYISDTLSWDGVQLSPSDFGTQLFATIRNANNTVVEFIELDPSTISSSNAITILKRALPYNGDTTANTETAYNHNAFSSYVELGADTPQLLAAMVANQGDETITGVKTFSSSPIVPTPTTATQAANKSYADGLAIAGAPDSDDTTKGLVEQATMAEIEAGTSAGGTSAPIVVKASRLGARLYTAYAADAGSNDTYVITCAPVPTAYTAGMVITFKANTANTGACTVNVNTLGAKSLKVNKDLDPQDGYIKAGQIVTAIYDGTNFQIQSVSGKPSVSQSGEEIYAASSAGSDTYAITVAPAPAAYVTGQVFRFKADVANTGTCTLNVNGLGAKTIYKGVDNALIDNDILANQIVEVIYDGTNFQMLSALSNGRFTAGSFTTRSGAAGNNDNVNNDETIAVGFRPRFIRVHYYLMGYEGGLGYRSLVGSAMFSGTTLLANIPYLSQPGGSGTNLIPSNIANNTIATLSTTNTFSTKIDDTSTLQAGDLGNNNGVKLLLTINSVSGTGFVIRINETSQSSATGNNYRFQGWYEVYS